MKLSKELQKRLICPNRKSQLQHNGNELICEDDTQLRYPIIDGIPVLINDSKSLFSIGDFIARKNTTFDLQQSKLRKIISGLLPTIGANLKANENYRSLAASLPKGAKVLVVGGSIMGKGMDPLYSNKNAFEIVASDVSFGPYTCLICDAHDIPFDNETFDCVVSQAVLEHVLDPTRCVAEFHRVLKPTGVIYAETPFMQQVHARQYDFTRFTHLGHRRLFRNFEEISSGPTGGPGMALAWAYTYFLRSFATSRTMIRLLTKIGYLTGFFFKYFDYYLIDKPGSYDAASGLYFMGKKSVDCLSDVDLIKQFKGIL